MRTSSCVHCAHTLPRRAFPLPQTETKVVDAVHMRFAQIEIVTNRCKHACESAWSRTSRGRGHCRDGASCAHLLGVECVVGEIDLGERSHREAREHGTLRSNCIEAGMRAHSGEQGNCGGCAVAAVAAAHLSLKRLSSFSRSWIALCFTFDWSRSLSAASILQVRVSGERHCRAPGARGGARRGATPADEHAFKPHTSTCVPRSRTHTGGAHLFWLEVRIRCMRSSSSSSSSSSPAALTSVTSGM